MKKRIFSTLLALCLALALLPIHSFAASAEDDLGLALPKIVDVSTSIAWRATTVDGETINQSTYSGKTQVLVFFLLSGKCINSNKTLTALATSTFVSNDNVQIIALGVKTTFTDTFESYFSATGISTSDNIIYAYPASNKANNYFSEAGLATSNTFAKNVVLDSEGDIRAAWVGDYTADYYASTLELIGVEGVTGNVEGYRIYETKLSGTADYAAIQDELSILNAYRQTNGLTELTLDSDLTAAAMQRAAELAVYYAHLRPDGSSCFTVSANATRENIAIGYGSAEAVMTAWENSSGHNANILAADNQSVGLGCFLSGSGTVYWVQLFSDSASSSASAETAATEQTFSVSVIAKYLELSVSASAVSLGEGESAEITLTNTNQGYTAVSETIFATYAASDDKKVARASLAEDGAVTITPVWNGTATVQLGLAFGDSDGSPKTFAVTVTVSGVTTPPSTIATIDSGGINLDGAWVFAATYRTDGQLTGLVSSQMDGDTVTFSETLDEDAILFFLDPKTLAPLYPSVAFKDVSS